MSMRDRLPLILAGVLLACTAGSATADPTYLYRGPSFSTIQDPTLGASITASVTVQAWVPADYTGTLGPDVITSFYISSGALSGSGPGCQSCVATLTLAGGQVTSWFIDYFASGGRTSWLLATCGPAASPGAGCPSTGDSVTVGMTVHATNIFSENSTPMTGSWTVQGVPEPSEYALLGAGIVLLLGRSRHSSVRSTSPK